jgi:hypothetical protein
VISLIRYNLMIVAPTLLWTGILVALLLGLVVFADFTHMQQFSAANATWLAEWLLPVVAAFFAGGVLDMEMKRGAHELLRSKMRPLWHTVAYRLLASMGVTLALGAVILGMFWLGIKHFPYWMVLFSAIPSCLVLALVSLWTRVRLGNSFIGYMVALTAWATNVITGIVGSQFGINLNPLLTLTSYGDRLQAERAGVVDTTPYADWWWVPKVALLVVSLVIFVSITRRVENLVEGD